MEINLQMAQIIATVVFLPMLILIALEHTVHLPKTVPAFFLVGLWILVAFVHPDEVGHLALDASAETFSVLLFLLAALAQVNRLNHYRGFDLIRNTLFKMGLTDRGQFVWIFVGTFFGSAVLDNVSMAIVAMEIAILFFTGTTLVWVLGAIIIASNLGGAWSPFGDLSTFVLWIEGKFSAWEIVKWAFAPSFIGAFVAMGMILPFIRGNTRDVPLEPSEAIALTWHEYVVLIITMATFFFPLIFNFMGLPPAFGLAFGVGVSGFISWIFGGATKHPSHLEADIDSFINKVDTPTVQFFVILLGVSALGALDVLSIFSSWLVGANPTPWDIELANVGLGYTSAGVDNVPMAYVAVDVLPTTNPRDWAFTALMLGHGGSHTSFGSAAAVALIGAINAKKELGIKITFFSYLKYLTLPVAVSYLVAWAVWHFQPW